MSLSIGIDYELASWKICLLEDGHLIECQMFELAVSALAHVEHLCALYPEPLIGIAARLEAPLLSAMDVVAWSPSDLQVRSRLFSQMAGSLEFFQAIYNSSLKIYSLPSLAYLPTVPAYRRFYRPDLGAGDRLALVALLLSRLREQEAPWSEMNFFLLEVGRFFWRVTVIEQGRIVDGSVPPVSARSSQGDAARAEQFFWESLTSYLSGLVAIHHMEEFVITGEGSQTVIERFESLYQFYSFPHAASDQPGFEIAHGAAILADGFGVQGAASELVEQLGLQDPRADETGRQIIL